MSTDRHNNNKYRHTFKSMTIVLASFSITEDSNVRLGIAPTLTMTNENAAGVFDDKDWERAWNREKIRNQ